jgi:hypothetical protein
VTIAIRPLVGRDGAVYSFDLGQVRTNIFFEEPLDSSTSGERLDLLVGLIARLFAGRIRRSRDPPLRNRKIADYAIASLAYALE